MGNRYRILCFKIILPHHCLALESRQHAFVFVIITHPCAPPRDGIPLLPARQSLGGGWRGVAEGGGVFKFHQRPVRKISPAPYGHADFVIEEKHFRHVHHFFCPILAIEINRRLLADNGAQNSSLLHGIYLWCSLNLNE